MPAAEPSAALLPAEATLPAPGRRCEGSGAGVGYPGTARRAELEEEQASSAARRAAAPARRAHGPGARRMRAVLHGRSSAPRRRLPGAPELPASPPPPPAAPGRWLLR
ncbi:hypothetical protein STEG23_027036 [Scotinomys teguina]